MIFCLYNSDFTFCFSRDMRLKSNNKNWNLSFASNDLLKTLLNYYQYTEGLYILMILAFVIQELLDFIFQKSQMACLKITQLTLNFTTKY